MYGKRKYERFGDTYIGRGGMKDFGTLNIEREGMRDCFKTIYMGRGGMREFSPTLVI